MNTEKWKIILSKKCTGGCKGLIKVPCIVKYCQSGSYTFGHVAYTIIIYIFLNMFIHDFFGCTLCTVYALAIENTEQKIYAKYDFFINSFNSFIDHSIIICVGD